MTVLDHLLQSLMRSADHNRNDVVGPRVILWPDAERLWEPAVDQIRTAVPRLFRLGDARLDQNTGPAAYLRSQIPAQPPIASEVPILYLPGIGRTCFRTALECPEEARHLYALQFEGQFWAQRNGRDWTPFALLAAQDGGLGLDISRDAETACALRECLPKILEAEIESLRGRRLESDDLRGLIAEDPIRMLLRWIGQPSVWRSRWSAPDWSNFRAICRKSYDLDPEKANDVEAAERLAAGTPGWKAVWQRYRESPQSFPGVQEALARLSPPDLFDANLEAYPAINQRREDELRSSLERLSDLPYDEARKRVREIALREEPRTHWVWAKLNLAPLAQAASALGRLVNAAETFASGQSWDGLASGYTKTGWQVDLAALESLAAVRNPADLKAVETALRSTYLPWIERLAAVTQGFAATYPNRDRTASRTLTPGPGILFLFVDGLRFDIGCQLAESLRELGATVVLGHEWAALPSVTATAKPAWNPIAGLLEGAEEGNGFEPVEMATRKSLTTERFRSLLGQIGIQYLPPEMPGDPAHCAWTETGAFDRHGHAEGKKLAWRVQEQLDEVVHRVKVLLHAGWQTIRIITDHGWLLIPGGLPKLDLPKHLTETRWGRCAIPEPGAKHAFPGTPWYWDFHRQFVLAPGVGCFRANVEYSHGGLTLQEALIPTLTIHSSAAVRQEKPEIVSSRWKGLRISMKLKGFSGMSLDLRTKASDPGSSVLTPAQKEAPIDEFGSVSLLINRDELVGTSITLTLSDAVGRILLKHPLTIGEN